MAVGRKKGTPKTGGRPKGGRNKATRELMDIAKDYVPEAMTVLAKIMRNPKSPAAARVGAVKEICDRAYGKAPQALEHGGKIDFGFAEFLKLIDERTPSLSDEV